MASLAQLDVNDVVRNVIVADPEFDPDAIPIPEGLMVGIGTQYDRAAGRFLVEEPASAGSPLTQLAFIELCQSAGGMTDSQFVTATKDTSLEAFWLKFDKAQAIDKSHQATTDGLAALEALGYLPNGAAAVTAAWPTQ